MNGNHRLEQEDSDSSMEATRLPYACPIQVRYNDIDAMNHVNNAIFVTYLEIARANLWRDELGFSGSARDFPFILARVAVDFRSPIHLGDDVQVEVGVSRIGTTSFTFLYRVLAGERVAAVAESVQVMYDYARGRPVPLPAELRTALARLALAPQRP